MWGCRASGQQDQTVSAADDSGSGGSSPSGGAPQPRPGVPKPLKDPAVSAFLKPYGFRASSAKEWQGQEQAGGVGEARQRKLQRGGGGQTKARRRRPEVPQKFRRFTGFCLLPRNAIIKLGKLPALGFGEPGSVIFVKTMGDDTVTVNAMIPGHKVESVFGFCDILHFTDTTEVVQDKVMVFVNSVAEIVSDIVDKWHGAAKRNNGQVFLIVWRLCEDKPEVRTKVCDMAVVSFVHVLAAVNKSAVLKERCRAAGIG
eukprot:CAMPEP_0183494678 /NCGR_PEP_ID=MMETSP0370-20130417/184068_1 /TAXON_ID=268820 /ORGANISM="Peridinium aciculiferum, Strain PAER-2" /LENGTH=256 /DNA_ID=CAMNT_0025688021 /DNA_START=1 /DNA_END=768 /DNA_ORIENTATION=-